MREAVLLFRPIPSSPWLTHQSASHTSRIDITEQAAMHPGESLEVVGVTLNGVPFKWFKVIDSRTIEVHPLIRAEGGYLSVHCKAPKTAPEAPKTPRQGLGGHDHCYGLQAAQYQPRSTNT